MTENAVAELGTVPEEASTALAVQRPTGLLRPIAAPEELISAQEATRALVTQALKRGRDYGEIPGIDKPSLLKPGAERLCAGFGVFARFKVVEREVDHDREVPWQKRRKVFEGRGAARQFKGWEEERGTSFGLYRYVVECELVHRESGQVVGSCLGSCSTLESKYIDRPRDCENTVIKMAEKRAHVGAVLLTFGLSEQFTQDVEDLPREAVQANAVNGDDAGRSPVPPCPKCKGPMYDNRDKNLERKAAGKKAMPEFKCKDKDCDTVIWHEEKKAAPAPATAEAEDAEHDALAELELLMPELASNQEDYVRDQLSNGANPVKLLRIAKAQLAKRHAEVG